MGMDLAILGSPPMVNTWHVLDLECALTLGWASGILPQPFLLPEAPEVGICHFVSLAADTRTQWVAHLALGHSLKSPHC